MTERDFVTKFNRWLKHNLTGSAVFEAKLCKTDRFPYSSLEEHQELNLYHTEHVGLVYKIPDDTMSQKPYDCIKVHCPAYVAIMFYRRAQKTFYLIRIDEWMGRKLLSSSKSITEEECATIGMTCELK